MKGDSELLIYLLGSESKCESPTKSPILFAIQTVEMRVGRNNYTLNMGEEFFFFSLLPSLSKTNVQGDKLKKVYSSCMFPRWRVGINAVGSVCKPCESRAAM